VPHRVHLNSESRLVLCSVGARSSLILDQWYPQGQARQTFIINIFSCIWHLLSLILTVLQFTVFWIPTWYRQNLFWVHLGYWEGQVCMLLFNTKLFSLYYKTTVNRHLKSRVRYYRYHSINCPSKMRWNWQCYYDNKTSLIKINYALFDRNNCNLSKITDVIYMNIIGYTTPILFRNLR
jgi:hypothetical protein